LLYRCLSLLQIFFLFLLSSFLSSLPTSIFLPSFLSCLLASFLSSFFPSFLPCISPSFLHSFFLSSLLTSFLPSFLLVYFLPKSAVYCPPASISLARLTSMPITFHPLISLKPPNNKCCVCLCMSLYFSACLYLPLTVSVSFCFGTISQSLCKHCISPGPVPLCTITKSVKFLSTSGKFSFLFWDDQHSSIFTWLAFSRMVEFLGSPLVTPNTSTSADLDRYD